MDDAKTINFLLAVWRFVPMISSIAIRLDFGGEPRTGFIMSNLLTTFPWSAPVVGDVSLLLVNNVDFMAKPRSFRTTRP